MKDCSLFGTRSSNVPWQGSGQRCLYLCASDPSLSTLSAWLHDHMHGLGEFRFETSQHVQALVSETIPHKRRRRDTRLQASQDARYGRRHCNRRTVTYASRSACVSKAAVWLFRLNTQPTMPRYSTQSHPPRL